MGYDIRFKVKVEGVEQYIDVGDCKANITYNCRNIITNSTGLEWENDANNGLCKDIIPKIKIGIDELKNNPEKYRQYESPNGYGTVKGTINFFKEIVHDWLYFLDDYPLLESVTTFWIE